MTPKRPLDLQHSLAGVTVDGHCHKLWTCKVHMKGIQLLVNMLMKVHACIPTILPTPWKYIYFFFNRVERNQFEDVPTQI